MFSIDVVSILPFIFVSDL